MPFENYFDSLIDIMNFHLPICGNFTQHGILSWARTPQSILNRKCYLNFARSLIHLSNELLPIALLVFNQRSHVHVLWFNMAIILCMGGTEITRGNHRIRIQVIRALRKHLREFNHFHVIYIGIFDRYLNMTMKRWYNRT